MESLTERVSGLSADKRELLEALLRKKRAQSAAAATIRPRSAEGPVALSFSQERLWLIDQLEPDNPAYNMPLALRLSGALSPVLLERVFAEIVRRHEALRTTFAMNGGQPVQVIDPVPFSPALPVVDLAHLPATEREEAALHLARKMARQPFDLQRGPLLRLALLRLGVRDHLLLVNLHHIISDGWSLGVLQREVSVLYEAFALGRLSPLPGLPVQYADFALWQRSRLQGEELERQLAFWRRRLAGAPPVLELPTDRPRPSIQSFRGALRTATLPPALSGSLRELCRRKDATPFMALLAAWAVLLGRHASQEDVVVGTPVAGRSHWELEGLIGFFVNTLALRIGMDGGPSFEGLLEAVREDVLEAFSHQDLPFERLVGELATDRSLAHAPLFQVLFALQNAPGGELTLPGLRLAPVPLDSGMAKFDLTLTLAEGPSGLTGTLEYSTDLFDASTAERLLARFETLLDGALANPDTALPDLPLLLAAERQQLLVEWNDTESAFPREACLPELFEEVAREMPEAPAIVTSAGEVWSYRRLDETSNRLARRLRALGVGPETAVGLCMDRSAELIAGTLAILKAGGVYVPLDAGYPDERLAFLLQDTGARIVLVHAPTRERIAGPAQVVAVDGGDWMLEDAQPLGTRVPAGSLACVIYTSGSTGRPKGVAVPHRAVVRLVRETDYVRLGPGERTGHVANISFDAATYEIWGALLTGAAVVVIPRDVVLSPADFARWIEERGVTSMFLTSALFTRMSREVPDAFAGMSELLVGGEAVDPVAARTVLAGRPPRRLLNGYGPTESTTFAAWHTIRAVSEGAAGVPIGSPLANTTLYVLDRSHAAVPPGSAGELCIGGDGLARGYLNRPELTAESFLPNPWEHGGRLYRTGDLVRQRADGVLEYLGRLDHQVKIRGFRIEPGEIEAVLAGHPGVRECAVLARRDSPGDARLVAYVAGPEAPEALRSWLAARLPDFMLPSAFVTLDALPLTPNGKLDRRALPAPEQATSTDAEAPSDPVEELLTGIWAEVLRLPRVGVHDDFFALGGHSLLATQVTSRLREVLGVDLPLRALFEAPTVAALARVVREERQGLAAPPIVPVPREGDLPLSFAQQRLWLLDQLEPGSPAYNVPLALRLTGEVDPARLERIFAEIVRRHEVLRTTFDVRRDRAVQVISPELRPGLPVVDLSHLPAAEREAQARRLALEEARRPFDLRSGPQLRLALVRLDDHGHLLLVTLHHIVSDGWSMGVLLREIAALAALEEGRALPELPVQYADFAVWQQAWLQGEVLESQLGYWTRQLAGAPRLLELPLDRPRPAVQTYNGAQQAVALSPDLSEAVRRLCREQGVTPFMALLAAWAVLLGRHAGQDDVLIGSPIAGRNRREIEGLIGFFVNTLVLRTDFSGSPTFRELLVRVRQTALDGYAHQDLPFERIVEEVVSERDLAVSPLFQVLFALQNAPVGELTLPGLSLTPVSLDGGVAKFDLSLSLGETPSGFAGALEHNTDLFDAGTAERLWERFLALLEAAAADPAASIADLPLLLPAEREQLLTWNETGEAPPSGLCLHDLFAAQAVRTPHATALIHGEERLTYTELAGRAGGIARHLLGLGVGPEVRVAVCLERSPDLIAALLGVLAAGGAYVPVDPSYPEDRRAFMVEDSGAALLLTRVKDIPPADLPAGRMKPGHLAYLIYTSGSTGRPKGVAIEHRSAVALMDWARESFSDEELSGVLAATSACFDLSVFEIFVPLAFGGRIVLAENALALPELPAAGAVRLLNTVPSAAAELVRSGGIPASVQTVCLAGEPLPATLAQRLHATGTVRRVLNLYGPSEDTTYSTGALVPRNDPRAPAIGRPVRGTRAWAVDRHGGLVPSGVAGELWLAGAGLARGYLGRPELTAERFTPDPFGGPGDRVYRTGDLVRRRSDGELEFLGRIDHQIKVRGFRIELGEIEAVLASHPAVREGAVVAREDVLVAYVAGSGEAPDAGTLRAFLGQRLPEFMVPSSFVVLDALPLSPNGKVDRKALPAPDRTTGRRENVAPRTKTEETVAAIWKELLGLDQIGVEDRFFELGGHSLLATQVLSRVRQVFGIDIPLREVFRHPTVAGLAALIDAQAPVPARLASPESEKAVTIRRRSTAVGPVALSFAQERLWVIDQLEPGTPAYNMPLAVRLTGKVAPGLLARIFEEIVRRHEALRTTFTVHGGQPAQAVAKEMRLALPLLDLSGLPEEQRDEQARRLAREEAWRSFDLQRGPLLRVALVRLGERGHLLLVTMHHIVSDGWSLGVLLRELGVLFEAFSEGRSSPLPELPVQYADFAVWQRGWLQGEVLETQLAFWKDRLAGAPRMLELPTDRPRPAVQSFRGATRPVALPLSLAESLRELGLRADATPFMALLAAWAVLLGRHAGQDDVLIGSPIAGRNRREIEGLIGLFVNTLVLRTDFSGSPTFRELLVRIRQTALDGYAHQDLPFERIVEEVVSERDLAVSPLFQVLFALQNAPVGELAVPGLTLAPLALNGGVAKFDLSLSLGETPSGFSGALEFNTDLLDAGTAERLWERFLALLEAAVGEPDRPVAELPLLLPAEREQLLTWNETGEAPPSGLCLHELFAAQAVRTPQATALIHGEERLAYAELAGRAGGIARHLLGLGVGPEVRVAVCLERSPDLIAALLGVLAAGGAYVPVDPSYPEDRRAFMVEDSGAELLLTRVKDIPPADLPAGEMKPGHLAYLIYTSGSTGRPKGVAIEHRSAVALVEWARESFSDEELSGVLAATSVCFDLSVFEIFVPLAFGGTIVLAENALALPGLPAAGKVRLLNTVPSAAAELVRSGGIPASVQTVCLAGEPLPATLAQRLHATGTVRRVLNLYGPSEDTTYSTGALVPRDDPQAPAIGWPVRGTRAWVVDRPGALVPPGVAGELWLAGAGLARGYLDRPELTAERFTPDPFGGPGDRVYRTGDLVRRRPDGELEFLGRIDHQVKVRGFRIELGEIEAALASHPAVREGAVVAREDVLVAYVAGSGEAPDAGILRAFLSQRLPEFMIPSSFMVLDALPLSPNGKVDRKALPAPDRTRGRRENVAPRTKTEETVAAIWKELLGLDQIGVEDRFFELGGHSLLATQVLSRVRQAFGVDIPLREVFRHPTVAGLAALIDAQAPVPARLAGLSSTKRELLEALLRKRRAESAKAATIPRRSTADGPWPLSSAQERLWLIDQLEPGTPAYNMPLAVRLTGEVAPALLARIFEEIVRRHEALRTTFTLHDGRPVQEIAGELRLPLPLFDLSALPEAQRDEQAHRLAREEAGRGFDLRSGPLLRLVLVRLDGREHLLLATMHHIVSDGWSLGVLLRELGALYEAFSKGLSSPLPELPVQYADFAVWQRGWLQGEVLETQLVFWKDRLAGAPHVLELPTDRPRPAVQSFRGASRPVSLPLPLTESLRELGRRADATPFMVLLTAWAVLLGRHAGQDDLLVGTPIAGRNRWEIEGLIGVFVNTLVLRAELGEGLSGIGPTFLEVLGRVRSTALDAFAHQDLPFERLVEELVPERDLARSPLFQALFVLQNTPGGALRLPGLSLAQVETPVSTAKLDLTLSLIETSQGLAGALEYAIDLFDASTVQRLLGHFENLLASAAADTDGPLSGLRLMDATEERLLTADLNRGERTWAASVAVHDLFTRQAGRTPDKTAAVGPRGAMTYREIDERSNVLAARIGSLLPGVRLDRRIGLLAGPEPEVLIGMLGILKAGGGFVPIDPRHPEERAAWILEDSVCEVLVTDRQHLEPARRLAGPRHVLRLDEMESSASPAGAGELRALAYIVYTSGSTGRPKGVQVSHESLVPMLLWGCNHLGLGEHTRVLQSLSHCFDFGIFEHLTTLLAGGTLCFPGEAPGEAAGDPEAFAREVVRHGIDTLHTTPAFARELAAQTLDSLAIIHLGGEALPRDTVARLREAAPRTTIYNGYGPTEATINSSIFRIEADGHIPAVIPIGRRSADNTLYILDRSGRLVPFGARGELHVGGIGVARGYLGRPELTAEHFVPDPFGEVPGGRLYRTGDLVRYLSSGDVEFLGRIDHQVKLRGFRIELGEIEAVLRNHPAVRDCVVVVRGDILAAYLVPAGQLPDAETLRGFLAQRLPEPMIPSAFVTLDTLPLTPNGKVDRRALPAPELARQGKREILAPRTSTETTLAEIWKELLGLERVGVDERFFELGGHSLLATRALSRIRHAFGIELPLREIFQHPTIAGLAERIEAQAPVSATKAETGRRLDGPLPLSFSQERLWLIDQLEPGTPAYNMPLTVRLTGEIVPPRLARIFGEIVRRHETLRTTFAVHDGSPVQVIAPPALPSLPVLDLTGLPEACREAQALQLAREEVRRSFDLGRGPLLRLALVRLGEREHLLLATLHHIISDGWSKGVLLREIQTLYAAFAQGLPSPLPELSLQYADFALRQRSWLQGEILAAQLDWWRRELADAPGVLALPLDRPRTPLQSRESALLTFALPAGLTVRLQELARREGLTTFMVLLAAFQALLHRLGGQDDVLVGTPVANRRQLDTEGLIGFFVNTLVLRARTFSRTFVGLLERTRETVLGAFEHQDVPFERLVEELVPDRTLSVAPLFQVSFSVQTASGARVSLPGLTLEALPIHSGKAQFDLSLDLLETGGALQGSLEISRALFDRTTGRRMVESFVHLLQTAVATPELPIARIPLLDEAGRHQILHEWNGDEALPDRCGSILPLFERQAALTPGAPAVSLGGQEGGRRLTYGELDRRADRLARRLRGLGVGPEARVAVVAERTPELIVAFLGILKAGGAYVPLDPAYPEERRALMLEDSRALLLGPEMMEDDPHPRPLPQGRGEPGEDQLAYVLYTSGSTGRPKGVMVSHGALARYVEAVRPVYGIGPRDRVLQFCSTSFDTSLEEIVPCLTAGAELVLRTDAMLGSVAVFLESCRAQGITVLSLPTAYWHEIAAKLESENLALPSCLRLVILGGERALPAWVETWRRCAPERPRLLNTYGLTEATIVSTATDLTAPPFAETRGEVSIGRAIRGTEVLLLDRENSPVPIGAPGELLIGGGLLARGYLGRPDLTAERFVPHPLASEPGARLYRTGDLARWRPGGDLEFAGRGDRQVKIRGYRIEIAEIEARLLGHPEVASAVAVVREYQPGEKRIAAYIVPRHEPGPAPAVLRAHLRAALPDYMVPGAWVTLSALPLTPNGKVDRRALPAPDPARQEEREIVAPRTRTEETLADIWKELLGLDQVGVEDRFFELGGHSLLATRVLSRIRQAFGIELPLREIFQHPTIAGLAERIDEQAPAAAASIRRRRADSGPLPLSFSQERLWLIDQLDPGTPAYNMPLAIRLTGVIAPALLARIFAEIVRRHEALRTTFAARDGQPHQVIHQGPPPVLPLIDLSCLPEPDREAQALRLAREEARRSFDLQRGPLLRVALLRLGAREHVLLVTLHHIVSDGWSMDVLLREIQVLAGAFAQGLPSPLAELPVQYADFALWQRSHLQGEVLAAQLDWWRRELTGAPGVLALPLDRPRSPLQSSAGEILPFVLPTGPTARLQGLARREGLSSFMVLLAAFQTLLHRLGGQDDVLVGTPVANRRLLETESLIGFFVNTLVLRGRPGSASTFQGLLKQTRETVLGAFDHQDAPFERLVEELVPDRDLSVAPLFQVVFNLQTAAGGAPAPLPGLTLEALPVHSGKAQFELSLDLLEAGDEIAGSLEISRALFDRTTGQRMLELFSHLLRATVETPDLRIAEIPLLDETQRHQLLREWGEGGVPAAGAGSILPLFERRAAERPDAPAVSLGGQAGRRLTYGELDRRANRLAHRLRGLGVGPETPVAVLAERTPELIVAFLGILKAGGAYVPVDPAYPEDRRAFMLEDSRALLLTPELLEDDPRCSPLSLGRGAGGEGLQLAYVLYTSGSTGRPKGVMGSHGALARYADMVRPVYGIGPDDRVLQFCSTSFDTSLEEIVACLTAGAELVLRTDTMLGSVATFLDACCAQGVTVLSLPTAYWHEIAAKVEAEGLALPPCLRLVIIGGERALVARVAAWRRSAPERPRLLNSYGVTESTIVSTATDLAIPSASEARGEVSIGRALRGTDILLLDRELEPVPIGTAGELLIGGALLARGYLGRPDLTAERFVPHPFPPEPGARLYRTGDLARALPDGALEFIGRGDRQVKIRGYRIETEEIEARLLLHPEVESAVVVVREDRPGEKLIAAYLVPRSAPGQAGPAPAALRAFVRETLPDYMVPSAFVLLDALPLSPNGKIDRKALPAPERARDAEHLRPRDALELQLVQIWEEVLGQPVGVRDDFFALGGHSLLAVQLTARIQSRLGRSLALASLLRHPTVERLAALLRQEAGPSPRAPLVELAPGHGTPLFLVHPVGGEVLCYVPLARHLDRPVHGLQAGEEELTLEEMAALYLRHVREAQPEGPYLLGGWSLGGAVAYEMARQLEAAGATVDRVILIDSYAPGGLWHEEVSEAALVASFAADLARLLGIGGVALPEGFGERGRSDALGWLGARAEEAGLLPPGLGAAELERRFATFAANHRAMAGYSGGPCAAPLLLMRAMAPAATETDLGWERIAGQPVEVHEIAGDHYTLLQEPGVVSLASALKERLGAPPSAWNLTKSS